MSSMEDEEDDVPSVAIHWLTQNASSNVELAILSNVNRHWRAAVATSIVREHIQRQREQQQRQRQQQKQQQKQQEEEEEEQLHQEDAEQQQQTDQMDALNYKRDDSGDERNSTDLRPLLLLPSIVQCLVRHIPSDTSAAAFVPSHAPASQEAQETFCAAWFPPSGIQSVSLTQRSFYHNENNNDDDDEHNSDHSVVHFAPSGELAYQGSEDEQRPWSSTSKPQAAETTANTLPSASFLLAQSNEYGDDYSDYDSEEEETYCCYEWRGYRDAENVLRPFGYTKVFVRMVLDTAVEQAKQQQQQEELLVQDTAAMNLNDPPELELKQQLVPDSSFGWKPLRPEYQTTCAVRGATFARPEGYCLCWDVMMARFVGRNPDGNDKNRFPAYSHQNDCHNTHDYRIRQPPSTQQLAYYQTRQRSLKREVMPCVKRSSPHKYPLDRSSDLFERKSYSQYRFQVPQKQQKNCVQFLNATRSNAVRMQTPPFGCGPLQGPVTVVCIGIATEDGCFLSGLAHRFELGHMYPATTQDNLTDKSPICLATDLRVMVPDSPPAPPPSAGSITSTRSRTHSAASHTLEASAHARESGGEVDEDSSSSSSSGDESPSMARGSGRMQCACPFKKVGMVDSDGDHSEQVSSARCVRRGQRGPGLWHCYVAIFDGDNSVIRVDGVEEPMQTARSAASGNSAVDSAPTFTPGLDGLTIGSDHCFDMSLCMGESDDGEGEGAISELIVFQGRLPLLDIECLELQLMAKHGIEVADLEPGRHHRLVEHDHLQRIARALIEQPPPWTMMANPRGVPLSVMAKDRSVAWHRINEVTGEALYVARIGNRFCFGSSDW